MMNVSYCDVCDLECGNVTNYNSHLQGIKHRKKLQVQTFTDVAVGTNVETVDATVGDYRSFESRAVGEGDVRCYAILARRERSPIGRPVPPRHQPRGFLAKVVPIPRQSLITPANRHKSPPKQPKVIDETKGLIRHWKRLSQNYPTMELNYAKMQYRTTQIQLRDIWRDHWEKAAWEERDNMKVMTGELP
jgi:hypothetical protein